MHGHAHLSTFLFQTVNFLVLVLVLRRWLYRPVLAMIARRQHEAEAPLAAAAADRTAAAEARAAAEQLQAAARGAHDAALAAAERELEAERRRRLDEARRDAEALMAQRRAELEQERGAAERALRERAAQVAAEIAGRLVRAAGCPNATDRLLDQALEAIDGLAGASDQAAGRAVSVLSAVPIAPERRGDVTARLRRALGAGLTIEFAEDPDLLAGVEIRLPTAVVRQNWRDQLAEARRSLS